MAKSCSVELVISKKSFFEGILSSSTFLQTFLFELAHLMLHACKKSEWVTEQNFEVNKCFVHVLFPVRAILRRIFTSGILQAQLFLENCSNRE